MTFVSGVISYLRETRLWPLAVGLLVTIPALPLLLGQSASPQAPRLAAASGAGTKGVSIISVQSGGGSSHLGGTARDPFIPQPTPIDTAATSTGSSGSSGTSAAAGGSSASGGGGAAKSGSTAGGSTVGGASASSSGGTTSSSQTTPSPDDRPTSTPATTPTYSMDTVSLRLDRAGGGSRNIKTLRRLAPLPSANDPFLVFLGVKTAQPIAAFLVSSEATVAGPGHCQPSRARCQRLYLRPHQREVFLVLRPDAVVYEYTLTVSAIHPAASSSRDVSGKAPDPSVNLADRGLFNDSTAWSWLDVNSAAGG